MSKNIHYPAPNFNVSYKQMFVYYNSLRKDSPELANNVLQALHPIEQELDIEEPDSKMQAMISFLKSTIEKERNNEKLFLQKNIINNKRLKDIPSFTEKIENCFSSEKIDYLTLIALFNTAFKGINNFKKNLVHEKNRIDEIQTELKKLKSKMTSKEKKKNTLNYYTKTSQSDLFKKVEYEVQPSFTKLQADKIKTIIKEVFSNKDLQKKCRDYLQSQGSNIFSNQLQTNQISKEFILLVTEKIVENFSEDFAEDLENKIDKLFSNSNSALFPQSFIESNYIQKAASPFKTNDNGDYTGEGLADLLLKTEQQQEKNNFEEAILSGLNQSSTEEQENIKNLLNILKNFNNLKEGDLLKIGKTTYKKENNSFIIVDGKNINSLRTNKQLISQLKRNLSLEIKTIFNRQNLFSEIEKIYLSENIIKINVPALAEVVVALETKLNFNNNNVLIGNSLNLKNDIDVFFQDCAEQISNSLFDLKDKLLQNFASQLSSFEHSLREQKYGKLRTATTDQSLSADAFLTTIQTYITNYSNQLKQQNLEAHEIEEELKKLFNNSFYVQTSVKNIEAFDDDLGFIGGTLGSNWEIALSNLLNMYIQGGIDPINLEWLKFAIMNCSSASLGGYLKNPIQKYLSFAAAMMMFTYGEAELRKVTENLKESFPQNGPDFVNFYVLNGLYFPSSYILTLILENVTQCFNILNKETAPNKNKTGVKIINKSSPSWIDSEADPFDAEWMNIRNRTNHQIQIIFTFLAGFLDILDALEEQMNKLQL